MADLKLYDIIDMNPVAEFIRGTGVRRVMSKGEYFARMNCRCREVGIVCSGGFAFSLPDYRGDNQILSLALAGEFIGSFVTLPDNLSFVEISALCRSEIYTVPIDLLYAEMDSGRIAVGRDKLIYAIAYGFMLSGASYRCDSPETRYRELLARVPDLHATISMTAIASYLGVTRETFARMRRRMKC